MNKEHYNIIVKCDSCKNEEICKHSENVKECVIKLGEIGCTAPLIISCNRFEVMPSIWNGNGNYRGE